MNRKRLKIAATLIGTFLGTSLSTLILFSQSNPAGQSALRWTLAPSPTRDLLSAIRMVSPTRGFIVGERLFEYDGIRWTLSPHHPPSLRIDKLFVVHTHNIWTTSTTPTFETELYHFDGRAWTKKPHPIANLITAMHFDARGNGWVGGWNELAYFDGVRWAFVEYPPTRHLIRSLFGPSKDFIWIRTDQDSLYLLNRGSWQRQLTETAVKEIFFENAQHGFALTAHGLYEWSGAEFVLHSRNDIVNNLTRIAIISGGRLWGVGSRGLVAHYDGKEWNRIPVPTANDLTDIQMISEREGWIVGTDGVILRYGKPEVVQPGSARFGFELTQIAQYGKEIHDEYGIAIEDVDGDGKKDVYAVCIYDPNRLYMNLSPLVPRKYQESASLTFREEAVPRGSTGLTGDPGAINLVEIYLGVGMADIDNDGDQDLYLCDLTGRNKLFLNNGSGVFRNVTDQANRGGGGRERSNIAIFGDVDNDGHLDLFVTNEERSNRLYLNDGNGYFTDVTEHVGLKTSAGGMGASFADIDGDGDLDLCVANWSKPNLLYRNDLSVDGKLRFENISDSAGIGGPSWAKSNAVVFADIDNDGDLDLFITNRKTSNRLYRNDGKGFFEDLTATVLGIDSMLSYGASFADFDQDGHLDLFVANVGGSVFYRNIDGRYFAPVTDLFGASLTGYCTGTATGDIDNDGDIDLYVGVYVNGSSMLFVNNVNNGNFLIIDVKGTMSNRDGVGANVRLFPDGMADSSSTLLGFREINGGSGYGSHNAREAHFGVNKDEYYDLVVLFPASGIKRTLRHVQGGQRIVVQEEEGFAAWRTLNARATLRFVSDRETVTEIIKAILVLLLLAFSGFIGRKRYRWTTRLRWILGALIVMEYGFQIALFLHDRFLLSTVLPVSSVVILLLIVHLWYDRVVMVRLSREEKQATRDRIARDLHDDIASTLSSAGIYVDVLRRSIGETPGTQRDLISRISSLLLSASEAITEIVWTVAPQHDTLGDLVARLRILVDEVCGAHSVNCSFHIDVVDKSQSVPDLVRRNLHLIVKEGLNNIFRHAAPRNVMFEAVLRNGSFRLLLQDDGKGFSPTPIEHSSSTVEPSEEKNPLHGHGLRNMQRRAEEIGAYLSIESSTGSGTKITLAAKMT